MILDARCALLGYIGMPRITHAGGAFGEKFSSWLNFSVFVRACTRVHVRDSKTFLEVLLAAGMEEESEWMFWSFGKW